MAVEPNTVAALLEKLKVDDPWVPPKPWESIPSESGSHGSPSTSHSQSSHSFYQTSNLSESSLVGLSLNALQGVESALIAVDQLSSLFCSDSADRTFHRISSLWTWSSSTRSLGNLLKSIGQFGYIVFLLQKFVLYFTHLKPDGDSGSEETPEENNEEKKESPKSTFSVVNQAFAIAVKKILDGYISALNTLCASVSLRRTLKNSDGGCLMNVGNSEITVLEVYLHTKGLRTQIETLGNICQISDIAYSFAVSPFEDLSVKANLEFTNFPRGGTLLTFLYTQLKVVDPVHFALLKFLFLQSFEPYYCYIRSWIYGGRLSDPYKEFVMEYVDYLPPYAQGNAGISTEFPLVTVRVRDGVTLPCFLEDFLIPLLRAGQQLQVVMKLLELCYNFGTYNNAQEEILPFLDKFPSEYPFLASSLTFHKGNIGKMVLARNSYYQRMLEKVENILTKFEFRSQQGSLYPSQFFFAKTHARNLKHADFVLDDNLVPAEMDERVQNSPVNITDNEASSSADEFSYMEDLLESSESSSVNSFEEQNDSQQMPYGNIEFKPSYLSSLTFSFSAENLVPRSSQSDISCSKDNFSSVICERTEECHGMDSYHKGTDTIESSLPLPFGEQNLLLHADTRTINDEYDACLQLGCMPGSPSSVNGCNDNSTRFNVTGSRLELRNRKLGGLKSGMLSCSNNIFSTNGIIETNDYGLQHSDGNCALSHLFCPQSWNPKYGSNFLSMNPTLSKGYLINASDNPGDRFLDYKKPLSYFDFTSVKDPCKVCQEKLVSGFGHHSGFEHSILTNTVTDAAINTSDPHGKENCSHEDSEEKNKTSLVHLSSDSQSDRGEDALSTNTTGGSKWETLLACFGNTPSITSRGYGTNSVAAFDMPLDYVIKKCLWEEILLQYRYVSKLTLKLFEEGFDLQEHLLALRRYHFMEIADWADLFIMSLWHHKWQVADAGKRILEIQGVLELSVQRSSCEGDLNKDRLYAYMKGDGIMPLSGSANGIHSFDFLGLGYRVDWPISIILTPDALKIYSDIFNFLIQVKLAVFSLSDVWCKLKDLVQLTGWYSPSERLRPALRHISLLTETRHQVNHFISTLQQYVQSKLSHVSWCKFSRSLKHKVKDMMDLEAVHMEYLMESLHICFLSEEAQSIANIIQSILQCAVDFRSCLVGCTFEVVPGRKVSSELPQIDIVQVLAIKKTFTNNLKDLFLCYLKSPKHGEIGLSRFWDYLNYNNFYSEDRDKQLGHNFLSI